MNRFCKYTLLSASLSLAAFAAVAAHADPVPSINPIPVVPVGPVVEAPTTYDLSATLADGGTVAGTVTFSAVTLPVFDMNNVQTGTVSGYEATAASLLITDLGVKYSYSGQPFQSGTGNSPYGATLVNPTTYTDYIVLYFPGTTPLASEPVNNAICTVASPCGSTVSYFSSPTDSKQNISSATLTSENVATLGATPEPSSLMLLGTGALAVAGAARRRLLKQ